MHAHARARSWCVSSMPYRTHSGSALALPCGWPTPCPAACLTACVVACVVPYVAHILSPFLAAPCPAAHVGAHALLCSWCTALATPTPCCPELMLPLRVPHAHTLLHAQPPGARTRTTRGPLHAQLSIPPAAARTRLHPPRACTCACAHTCAHTRPRPAPAPVKERANQKIVPRPRGNGWCSITEFLEFSNLTSGSFWCTISKNSGTPPYPAMMQVLYWMTGALERRERHRKASGLCRVQVV